MATNLESEFARINSFKSWPHAGHTLGLARRGFYYEGNGRSVVCYQCRLDFEDWQDIEELLTIHRVRSPGCILSSVGFEDGRREGVIDNSANSTRNETDITASASQQTQFENTSVNLARRNTVENKSAATADPNFDQLCIERVRLETFHYWPHTAASVVDPRDLAEAGLFYTGLKDRVQCAFCRGFLWSWIRGDIPADKHRKRFPDCPFVRGLDVGNVRIVDVSNDTPGATAEWTSAITSSYQRCLHPVAVAHSTSRLPDVTRRNRTKLTDFEPLTRRPESYRGRRVGSAGEGLAQAGFTYRPIGDSGPGDKDPVDDPGNVHVARYPQCHYVQEQHKLVREFEADRRHSAGRVQQNSGERQPTHDGSAETEPYPQNILEENARIRMKAVSEVCLVHDLTTVPCGHLVCSHCLSQLVDCRCYTYGTLKLHLSWKRRC